MEAAEPLDSFSFSFNEPVRRPDYIRKYQFGLNLLHSQFTRITRKAFGQLRDAAPTPRTDHPHASLLLRVFRLIKIKRQTAGFIHWYIQSIKLSSQTKVSSALDMVASLNSFSRQFIACSSLVHLFKLKKVSAAQLLLNKLKAKTSVFASIDGLSLLPPMQRSHWMSKALHIMAITETKNFTRRKVSAWHKWKKDLKIRKALYFEEANAQFKASEALFQAKEAQEQAEFEKEELAAALEAKVEELNNVLDVLEQYKTWHQKLGQLEDQIQIESNEWKHKANALEDKLQAKDNELLKAYKEKKQAEEEALNAYRALEKLKKGGDECDSLKKQLDKLKTTNLQLQNKEYEYQQEIENLNKEIENLTKELTKAKKKPPPKKVTAPKRTLELEKPHQPADDNRFALEIVNLNKQLTKLRHEHRTQTDTLKKTTTELEALKKTLAAKSEALDKVRRENDQLSISLSTDHHKSVHKLETRNSQIENKLAELQQTVNSLTNALTEKDSQNTQLSQQVTALQSETNSLKTSKADDAVSETLRMFENRFFKLKEYSDKQIQMLEASKLDNLKLLNEIENYKSLVRSSRLHAEKAEADADAYAQLLKQMEARLADSEVQRESAESQYIHLLQQIKH